jgi:uncharacterized membrane protein
MKSLRGVTATLAIVGVAVAGYLTWVHYADLQPICVGGSGACERVQASEYALLFDLGRTATAFLALAGALFSVYLTYIELAELHAVCQWCVVSALLMLALAAVSTIRLLHGN